MKKINCISGIFTKNIYWWLILFIALAGCRKNDYYNTLLAHIHSIKVISTHEHQSLPQGKVNFFVQLKDSYLGDDIISAGASPNVDVSKGNLDSLWTYYQPYLDLTRTTSYYLQLVKGYQKLYNFTGPYFTKDNVMTLSEELAENYKDYHKWFNKAFEKANFDLMIVDQYWNPYELDQKTGHFALASQVNQMIVAPTFKENVPPEYEWINVDYFQMAKENGFSMNTLQEYLDFSEYVFKNYFVKNSICLKNSLAYDRSLYFEDVPFETANKLYNKSSNSLTKAEKKQLMDFMFHWIIQQAIKYNLPIQIHTGYFAGNGRVLENGRPTLLNNLFLKYPKAKFILFHGAYPYTKEWIALSKMFTNVYLDMCWLPQISRQSAVLALDEYLDCVPYNKLFWGADASNIEAATGALELAEEVVAEVLANRVERGVLTIDVAKEIANCIFRNNAIYLFKIDKPIL
jgi:hypothetical protein